MTRGSNPGPETDPAMTGTPRADQTIVAALLRQLASDLEAGRQTVLSVGESADADSWFDDAGVKQYASTGMRTLTLSIYREAPTPTEAG
jgi:hypothetical protein